ncbi:hypothetical protein [Acutalibacter sp. JLR.KK004]|uniref:nucleotidyltransferase domain-containing protein n=1 Tax=Acutalibacter sp. JLR.KK004 TaxID=3112622 RepID=UPI002FEF488A
MLETYHIEALRIITQAAAKEPGLVWALTGSTSFALQGMDVQAHDIDIQTDRDSAYTLGTLLKEHCVEPVRFCGTEKMRSHFGRFQIGGAEVEIMGDIEKRLPDGRWQEAPGLGALTRYVDFEGMRLSVLSLRYEAEAYRTMGRTARAEEIEQYVKGEVAL